MNGHDDRMAGQEYSKSMITRRYITTTVCINVENVELNGIMLVKNTVHCSA